MHSLRSAIIVQYTNYGTGGAFELPTQSGTFRHMLYYIFVNVQTQSLLMSTHCITIISSLFPITHDTFIVDNEPLTIF